MQYGFASFDVHEEDLLAFVTRENPLSARTALVCTADISARCAPSSITYASRVGSHAVELSLLKTGANTTRNPTQLGVAAPSEHWQPMHAIEAIGRAAPRPTLG